MALVALWLHFSGGQPSILVSQTQPLAMNPIQSVNLKFRV